MAEDSGVSVPLISKDDMFPPSSNHVSIESISKLCLILNDDGKIRENDGLVISSEEFKRPLDMNKTAVKPLGSSELENVDSEKVKLLTSREFEENGAKGVEILDELIQITSKEPLQLALQQEAFITSTHLAESNDDTIIHYTAKNGSIECLSYLLNKACTAFPFESVNRDSHTILHSALIGGGLDNIELILNLIEVSGDNNSEEGREKIQNFLDAKTKKGYTALHLCMKYDKLTAIRPLLRAGAKLNICNTAGNTIIHLAAMSNKTECMKRVASYHVTDRPDTREALSELGDCLLIKNQEKEIPVILATESPMIEIILKYSRLEEVVDKEIGTLIHIAATENKPLLAQGLVNRKVSMDITNSKGFSPLKIASKRGHSDVVEILLKAGANPNFIGKKIPGFSPLNNAAQFGQLGCVKLLMDHGANLVHKDMTNTALHSASYGGHADVVEHLVREGGMSVNQKNLAGKTPLFQSITQNHSTVAKVLLRLGADPNIILNDSNETLMHIAVREGRKEIMTMLLESKASPDISLKNGITPLMLAVIDDHEDYIPLIMSHGVTLAKKDGEGNTVLHHIAMNNSCASAKYILHRIGVMKGISQEFQLYKNKNEDGKCAYDLAIEYCHEPVLKLFIKYAPKEFFKDNSKELHRFYDQELYGTIKEVMSGLVNINTNKGKVSANLKLFEMNEEGFSSDHSSVKIFNVPFLHKLENCQNIELKHHPLVKFIVSEKFKLYNWFHLFTLLHFFIFLICLGYALIQASTVCDSNIRIYDSPNNIGRAFCELFCLFYVLGASVFGKSEFYFRWRQIYVEKKEAPDSERLIKVKFLTKGIEIIHCLANVGRSSANLDKKARYFFTAFLAYFKEPFRMIEIIARFSFYIFVILRISGSHVQWSFAGLSFIFFSLTLLKHTRIAPCVGSYVKRVMNILSTEISIFLPVIIIITLAYIGGIHLAARQQPVSQNETVDNPYGGTCNSSSSGFLWFNPSLTSNYDLRRPLLSGIIFLLDGGPSRYENDLFLENFFFTLVYLSFAFIVIVMMLNILIAQLVAAYSKVEKGRMNDYKMGLVISWERSFGAWLFGKRLRKYLIIESATMSLNYWNQLNEEYETEKEDQMIPDMNTELNNRGQKIEKEFSKNATSQQDLRNKVNELSREMMTKLSEFSELKSDIKDIKQSLGKLDLILSN